VLDVPLSSEHQRRFDHPLTIVSTMRLTRRKRPMALLRTLQQIGDLVPSEVQLKAVIVGSGPQAGGVAGGAAST
jgi:hypothetical protein